MDTDFHLHTIVSDGLMTPIDVVERCAGLNIKSISITDHDAVGAYRPEHGGILERARQLGIDLTVGIELDVVDGRQQLHLLGFGFDPQDAELLAHLGKIQTQRRQRGEEELAIVNRLLGDGTVKVDEALPACVDTVMKPHLIRALLARRKFENYREAKLWVKGNVVSTVKLGKLPVAEGIALIKGAGGRTALAHPGYYIKENGLKIGEYLKRLARLGLEGVEAYYPYAIRDPKLFTQDEQQALQDEVVAVARQLKIETTRGSDCHFPDDFDTAYSASAPRW